MYIRYAFYKILKSLKLISSETYSRKTGIYTRLYKLIYRSKLFDEKWYLEQYPEIKNTHLSAIEHYYTYGFKEEKKPSKNFNPQEIFRSPCPKFFFGLAKKKNSNAYKLKHDAENKIENFASVRRKILLISHEFTLTGAPRALLNLAKILKEKGLEPVVLSPSFGGLEKELKKHNIEYYVEPLLLMKILFQEEKIKIFLNSFECIFFNSIVSLIHFEKYTPKVKRKIVWIHESALLNSQSPEMLYEQFAKVDEIYSVSAYAQSFVNPHVEEAKSKILPLYIEEHSFINTKRCDKLSFAIVGLCSARKGFDIFVEAIASLPDNIKENCQFKIIGKFKKDKFSAKIQAMANKENVFCTGELDYIEALKEINNTDVILSPSRDDSFSMVCAEGMMLGKVIACSTSTGISSFITHGESGYVFDLSTENLAQTMREIYSQQKKLKDIGENAKKVFQSKFTKEAFEENIKSIFSLE